MLLPGEFVPLHIFEERYKTMIGECLEGGHEFGVIWLSDDELKDVGCSTEVVELLERMEDGRMNIMCRGTRPFRLLERVDSLPYPAGTIELLDDDAGEVDPELAETARDRYADLVERVTDKRPEPDDLSEMGAYGMAATIDFGLDAKQGLLEARSETTRMGFVADLFARAMQRLDYVEKAVERARSNGKVRP